MPKTDPTVKKETLYVLSGVLFFTALLQLVLLLLASAKVPGISYTWVTPAASLFCCQCVPALHHARHSARHPTHSAHCCCFLG